MSMPYPFVVDPAQNDELNLSVRISTTTGMWLELNDHVAYTVADGSFEEQGVTFRRQEAPNPFLEGTFIVTALRNNVTDALNIYVSGTTQYEHAQRLATLKALFGQHQFQVERVVDDARTLWNCYASDYGSSASRPLLHARKSLLKVQLLHDPVEYLDEEI